jgi:hypothetical protein
MAADYTVEVSIPNQGPSGPALNVSALENASTVGPADEVVLQQAGVTKRATANEFLNGTALVTATGSTTGRSLVSRFSETINVLDYGADPTGTNDSWLAIQRAIHASFATGLNSSALTLDDVAPFSALDSVATPLLYRGVGHKIVYIPTGTYKLSRPLIISSYTRIYGQGPRSKLVAAAGYYGPMIEDVWHHMTRTYFATQPADRLFGEALYCWCHNSKIKDLFIQGNGPSLANSIPPTITGYSFCRFPFDGGGPVLIANSNHAQGDTNITLNYKIPMPVSAGHTNWRIQFNNHDTVYSLTQKGYGASAVTTISPSLTQSVPQGTTVKIGIGQHVGVIMHGGENSVLEGLHISSFDIGIWQPGSSPGSLIEDCSVWGCGDVGIWAETSPTTIIRPSGDGNNSFVRGGMYSLSQLTMIGVKAESMYPPRFRSFIEVGTVEQGAASSLTVLSGTLNANPTSAYSSATADGIAIVRIHREKFAMPGSININGLSTISTGQFFAVEVENETGNIMKRWPRTIARDGDEFFTYGSITRHAAANMERFNYQNNGYNARWTPQQIQMAGVGEPVFHGAGTLLEFESGMSTGSVAWTRSGTVVTFTMADHNLQVGDYVWPRENVFDSFPLTFPALDSDGYINVLDQKCFRVKTVVNASTFTAQCSDTGPTSGSARLAPQRYAEFHTMWHNEHRFQMPHVLGSPNNNRIAFGFYDKKGNLIAGARVPAEKQTTLWSSHQVAVGGSIQSPAATLLSGTGAPSHAAPNGSLYLRTDGDSSTTLYVRAGSSWSPLASY